MKKKIYCVRRSNKIQWGTSIDDELRADMCMPGWYLVMGLLAAAFGLMAGIVSVVLRLSALLIVLAAACLLLGIAALLCWKNQSIQMLSDDSFIYTTILGKKTVYRFDQIKSIKRGGGSTVLLMGAEKVSFDSTALLSARLKQRLDDWMNTPSC